MKNIYLILLLACFMTSCDKDPVVSLAEEQVTPTNYEGTYVGTLECIDAYNETDREEITIVISEADSSDSYFVDFGDDAIFEAKVLEDELIIELQTLNEGWDFDVVTMSGKIIKNKEDTFYFDCSFEVDDEGLSNCNVTLEKL